jgi:hypothetical protein
MSVFDEGLSKFDELAASQKVRLFDIYALGPALIYAATRKAPLGRWTKRTLFIAGVMTIVYNWKRYRSIKTDLEKAVANV